MKAVDDLRGIRCAPANAVGIELTAIAADDGDSRMLPQPGRERHGRAARQEVHDPMRRQIDQERAIAMASSPGPLVHPDGLQGWGGKDRGCPHQTQEGGRTGGQSQARGEPGSGVPAEGKADRLQGRDQAPGFAGVRGD
jgi:hypothetical protein